MTSEPEYAITAKLKKRPKEIPTHIPNFLPKRSPSNVERSISDVGCDINPTFKLENGSQTNTEKFKPAEKN